VVLGASFDPPAANKAFAEAEGFGYRLLSDGDRTVGASYEVTRGADEQYADFARRVAYLIDPDGVIRKAYEVSDVEGFAATVLEDLRGLAGGTP
jgi:peroxiredoxin Q/BCP